MAPKSGLAILLGAGPTAGAGIARYLASPGGGNLAVALLSRTITPKSDLVASLRKSCPEGVFVPFATDTSADGLKNAFEQIQREKEFAGLKLKLAVFNIKHSRKTPFLEETREKFDESLKVYVGGAVSFSQEVLKVMFAQYPDDTEGGKLQKKGTLVFTGTLGSLRTNIGYGAYGAGRSSVRMLAQSLAREFSAKGVQVVHAIANGGISDVDGAEEKVAEGKMMRAESVGKLYCQLMEQEVDLWVHELDMRPAAEKF